jgi:hypothetical protein
LVFLFGSSAVQRVGKDTCGIKVKNLIEYRLSSVGSLSLRISFILFCLVYTWREQIEGRIEYLRSSTASFDIIIGFNYHSFRGAIKGNS